MLEDLAAFFGGEQAISGKIFGTPGNPRKQ